MEAPDEWGAGEEAVSADATASRVSPVSHRAFALLTAAASVGVAVFFTLYSLLPVTRPEAPELGSVFMGTMMACVMAVQVFVPMLVRRWSLRIVLICALASLGLGALFAGISEGLPLLLLGAAFGGVGFGVIVVVGTQGVALFAPADSLGRAVGVFGLVTVLASAFGSPAGVQFALVFSPALFGVGAAVLCAAAGAVASRLPAGAGRERRLGRARGADAPVPPRVRLTGIPWFVLAFLLVGVLLLSHGLSSFAVLGSAYGSAALAIFCVQLGNAVGRWLGGELELRLSASVTWVAIAGCLAAAATVGVLVPGFATVAASGLLLGVGIGAVQTVTLHAVLLRLDAGRASVLWNLSVDAGLWVGGITWGLALTAEWVVPAVILVSCSAMTLGVLLAIGARRAEITGASRREATS